MGGANRSWHTILILTLPVDRYLRDLLCSSRLVAQCPSTEVCAKCYDNAAEFNNTHWLTWLECGQLPGHEEEDGITLIVGDSNNISDAIELPTSLESFHPQQLTLCDKVHWPKGCPHGYNCNRAHCIEELEYWKWSLVHRKLEQVWGEMSTYSTVYGVNIMQVPNYFALWEDYSYSPDEDIPSAAQVGLEEKLLPENYIDKFHKLVCLDEIAHCHKMASL